MKKKIIGLCVFLMLVSGCGKVPKLENGQEAIVTFENGEKISVDDFYETIKNDFGLQALITMIDTYVLETEFKDYIDTAKEQADAYVDAFIENYGGEDEFLDIKQLMLIVVIGICLCFKVMQLKNMQNHKLPMKK